MPRCTSPCLSSALLWEKTVWRLPKAHYYILTQTLESSKACLYSRSSILQFRVPIFFTPLFISCLLLTKKSCINFLSIWEFPAFAAYPFVMRRAPFFLSKMHWLSFLNKCQLLTGKVILIENSLASTGWSQYSFMYSWKNSFRRTLFMYISCLHSLIGFFSPKMRQ